MKYFFAICLALLIAGCTQKTTVEFNGTTPGITDGEFVIKNINDSVVCQTTIKDEKFAVTGKYSDGNYGYMSVNNAKLGALAFDVYLQPGTYTVTFNKDKPYKYPDIQSSVKRQNELTEYYHLFDEEKEQLSRKAADLNAQLKDPKSKLLSPAAYTDLVDKNKEADKQQLKLATTVLSAFVDKHPDNEIATRIIILNNSYMTDPEEYYKIFQKLGPATKESAEGKLAKALLDNAIKPASK